MQLTSSAFNEGELIPALYTCDGENLSPPLQWDNVKPGVQSFVLLMDDPDAPMGIWDHWVLYNIPANVRALAENIQTLPIGTQIGLNTAQTCTYYGPCPPDKIHRYFFKLYALDTELHLSTPTKAMVEAALEGHIIDKAILMGRYDRPSNS